MAWIKTSDNCISLYGTLIQLGQIDKQTIFEDAGPMEMQDLQFFNTSASSDINNASALALARLIDNMLVNSFGATYQAGFDSNKAISTMLPILQNATSTVENLSDTTNTIYNFS